MQQNNRDDNRRSLFAKFPTGIDYIELQSVPYGALTIKRYDNVTLMMDYVYRSRKAWQDTSRARHKSIVNVATAPSLHIH